MSYDQTGRPFIPVTLGTQQKYMLVDTGGALSMIGQSFVDQLGLPHYKVPIRQVDVGGESSDEAADVSPFAIGNLVARNMELMVAPKSQSAEFTHGAAGAIGPTILRNYDAEFDFGANTFKLLSQDHCQGKVIYWPASGVAAIPMRVARIVGHIIVPVTLDGVTLNALIDTGASNTFLSSLVAESDFGLKLDTPDVLDVGPLMGSPGARIYRHNFHTLSLDGITITTPSVYIIPDLNGNKMGNGVQTGSRISRADEAAGLEDITIGVDVLKHLHLYIAYKEQMLYVTPIGSTMSQPASLASPSGAGQAPASPAPH